MLTAEGQTIFEAMEDTEFCETLVSLVGGGQDQWLDMLFEEWILARLKLIQQRAARLFFGKFVSPLRSACAGRVAVSDVLAAMATITTYAEVERGDVAPEDWHAEIEEVFREGLTPGMDPGWPTVATYYRPLRGDMTVITGISSNFKSYFMHCLALNLAKNHGWMIAAYAPEHHPLGPLGLWLTEAYAGMMAHEMGDSDRERASRWVTQHFHMIRPVAEIAPTLAWLLAVARVQKQRYGLDGLILDPWNLIHHGYDLQHKSETKYVAEALSTIRLFASANQMHVWIVAHPTKPMNGKATSGPYKDKYPPPTPYDISGGAHWYNMLDNCLCCWRDAQADSNMVEIHIQKIRRRWQCGRVGKVHLRFDGHHFYDIGDMSQAYRNEGASQC